MIGALPSTEIHELVRRRLAENNVRYSSGRRAVTNAVQMASGPRSAAELAQDSTDALPISSLYRTLSIFEETGILKKDHGSDGLARYELAEWLTGHHHHVVCIACGAIEDIELSETAEEDLHAIASSLAATASFKVLDHVLEVEGVCPRCTT